MLIALPLFGEAASCITGPPGEGGRAGKLGIICPIRDVTARSRRKRKITVALKPSAVRTPCSAPHCVMRAVLAALASSGADRHDPAIDRHDADERVGPVGNKNERAEEPEPIRGLPPGENAEDRKPMAASGACIA